VELDRLRTLFEGGPAIRLLRSPNAAYIVGFLHRQFKRAEQISIVHSEIVTALADFQDDLRNIEPEALSRQPGEYVAEWSSSSCQWLARRLGRSIDEPLYQLTSHTEDALALVERVLGRDGTFVATESRLKLVIDTLDDLVVRASDDPEVRLVALRERRAEISREIEAIESGEAVRTYRPAQIRERLLTAVSLLRELQGDFRSVEDSFRSLTRAVQAKQLSGPDRPGGILEYVLDEEDLLKRSDQGASFYEFVRLILSPSETDRIEALIESLTDIDELAAMPERVEQVSGLIDLLQDEAQGVLRTNRRLSATLRRLLDERSEGERRRVAELLSEVRALALERCESSDPRADGLELDLDLAIRSPFRRSFWTKGTEFDATELAEREVAPSERLDAFSQLAELRHLDWRTLRARIVEETREGRVVRLSEVLSAHPPRAGVMEVLGYIQLARDGGHFIDRLRFETVVIDAKGEAGVKLELEIPLTIFSASEASH